MTRMHEEWIALASSDLGEVSRTVLDLGDGPTLRASLEALSVVCASWADWSQATTADDTLKIEQELEDSGYGFLRDAEQ